MVKKSDKKIERDVNKAQNKIESVALENIQEDYKTKTPVYIWLLKISIIFIIIVSLINVFINISNLSIILKSTFFVTLYSILLYGVSKRRKWSLYFGLALFTFNTISTLINEGALYLPIHLIALGLLYWHKDYLNQK
jgi:hypothetical protein